VKVFYKIFSERIEKIGTLQEIKHFDNIKILIKYDLPNIVDTIENQITKKYL